MREERGDHELAEPDVEATRVQAADPLQRRQGSTHQGGGVRLQQERIVSLRLLYLLCDDLEDYIY